MNARILGMLTLFATLLLAGTLGAQVNDRIRFQARLSDSGGAAITVGTSVEFNLYTTPTGGTSLWTETIVIVPNANGVFTTELGATTAFTGIDFSQPLYLGLTVDTDPEMTPRYLLTAQALAHYARNAGLLDGLDSSAFAQLGAASSTFTGGITAASFTGDGSGLTSLSSSALTGPLPTLDGSALTNLNASAISSGTLSDARLTANIPLLNAANNTFTGTVAAAQLTAPLVNATTVSGTTVSGTTVSASTIIATVTGQFPTLTTTALATLQSLQVNTTANVTGALTAGSLGGDGAALTNLNATNIASGTLADARLTGNVTLQGNAFNGNTQLVQTTAAGLLPALDGSLVTNVNALTLLGGNWAAPGAIGSTTANTGAFTTLSTTGLATLNSLTVTGAAGTDTLNVATTSSLTGAVTLGNDAATPVAGTVAIHDDQAANTFTGTVQVLTGGLTANRTYSLPDNTGTLALLSDITGGGSTGSFTTLSSSGLATLNSLSVTNNAGVGGTLTVTGGATAASFSGNGAALTNLDAGALATGTVAAARLTGSYAIDITGNAASATSVPAAGITGTITDAQVTNDLTINTTSAITGSNGLTITSGGITVTGGSFTGNLIGNVTGNVSGTASGFTGNLAGDVTGPQGSTLIANSAVTSAKILDGTITGADLDAAIGITTTGGITAATFTGNGSALTALNATALTSGTVDAARLSGSYAIDISGNAATATSATTASSVPAAGIVGILTDAQVTNDLTINTTSAITGSNGLTITSGGITVTGGSFTGNLIGNVTGNVSGTASGFTGNLAGDVTGPQGSTLIANGAVTSAKILDGTITGTDLDAAIGITTTGGITAASFSGNGALVTNVNALTLLGSDWASPAAIGSTAPSSGAFTTLSSNALASLNSLSVAGATGTNSLNVATTSSLTGAVTLGDDAVVPVAGMVAFHDDQAANLFTGTVQIVAGGLSADQTYSLPDNSGTLALLSDVTGGGGTGSFTTLSSSGLASLNSLSVTNNAGVGGALTVTGGVTAASFTGNGATLTNLDAGALATGTVPAARLTGSYAIDITGNAATASDAALLGGQNSAFHLARANHTGALPDAALTGTYTGALTLSNGGNAITGTFTGNGAALTNVDAASLGGQNSAFHLARGNHTGALPDAALTGTYTGALTLNNLGNAFTGTFSGNGAALTALNATALASGTVDAARLSGSYAIDISGNAATATTATTAGTAANALNLGGFDSAFHLARANHTGALPDSALTGTYTGALTLSNVGNAFTGTFTGNGAGLTGVTAASVAANNVTDGNLTLATGDLTLTGGTLTVSGNTSSFTAPLTVPGGTYTAHNFVSSVDANASNTSRTLRTSMTGTNAGTAEVTGAWLESISDGDITQGAFGQAVYTGGTGGGTAIGLDGRARSFIPGQALLAIGTAGRADDAQIGSNIGVHGWASAGDKNSGIFGVANASQAQQQLFGAALPSGFSAGLVGYNDLGAGTDFGLYVDAANNRIVGNLTVTGTITGSISGTAGNSDLLDSLDSLDFVRSTGAVNQVVTGTKTYTGSAFFGDTVSIPGNLAVTDGTSNTITVTGTTGSISATGTISATTFVGALTGNASTATTAATATNALSLGGVPAANYALSANVLALAGGTMTGAINLGTNDITNGGTVTATSFVGALTGNADTATTAATATNALNLGGVPAANYAVSANVLALAGGTMTGAINLGTNDITNGGTITATSFVGALTGNADTATTAGSATTAATATNALNLGGVPAANYALSANVLALAGGTMTGAINLGTNDITNGGTITATSFVGALTGNADTATTAATATNSLSLGGTVAADYALSANVLALGGGTMTGAINLGTNNISNGGTITATTFVGALTGNATTATAATTAGTATNSLNLGGTPAANYALSANVLALTGGTMTGAINLGTNNISNGGTITATTFVGSLDLASGNITNGGSASLTSATVTGAVVAGSVAANPGNSAANISNVPHWIEVAIPAFAAGTAVNADLIQLPAGAVVHGAKIKHSASFVGTNTSFTISVGINGDEDSLIAPFNVFQAPNNTAFNYTNVVAHWDHGSPTQLVVQATCDVNASNVGAGAGSVWLLVSIAD